MTIIRRIFQVSQVERLNQQFADVCIDIDNLGAADANQLLAAANGASDPSVVTFPHVYDPDKAAAWLAECFRYTEAEIDAMHPQQQALATRRAWVALGMYFQALNLRPYSLYWFRNVCARAWGGPPIGPTDESAARTLVRGERPYMTWEWMGAWREEAARRYVGGRRDPRTVIFGSQSENDDYETDEQVGCSSANTAVNANCPPPAEMHRCWLQNNGTVTGLLWTPFECADGGVTDGDNTDMDGTDDGTGDDPSQPRFWNWNAGAWEDSTPAVGRDRLFVLAPLRWYWQMICAPTRGLKVGGQGPDVSLVEWLWRTGPAQVLRTAKRDVVNKNANMIASRGATRLSELLGDAEASEGVLHEREVGEFRQIGNVVLGAAGTIATVGGPVGIIGGAVLGIAGAVMSFFPGVFAGGETITIDLMGRRMTAVEVFAQKEVGTAAYSYLEAIESPAPPPAPLPPGQVRTPGRPPPQTESPRPGPSAFVLTAVPVIIPGPTRPPAPPAPPPAERVEDSVSVTPGQVVLGVTAAAVAGYAAHAVARDVLRGRRIRRSGR